MTDLLLFTATGRFQAARALDSLPTGHRAARRHGHGFRVKVHADLPFADPWSRAHVASAQGEAPPRATAPRWLAQRLAEACQALDYQDLNALIDQPGDAGLAAWLAAKLSDALPPGRLVALGLDSTDRQGAIRRPGEPTRAWRRYRFEAAHRLPNVPAGHPCGRMHGHGFEVRLYADLQPEDPTGLLGYDRLDASWAPCEQALHHACLNQLPGLENPTSELLCRWLWQRLKPRLPGLRQVSVRETRTAGASYDGAQFRIWKDLFFESALCFPGLPATDPWHGLHGHSYRLRLMLRAPLDAVLGWTVDFGDVKRLFKPIYARLDHQDLSALPGLEQPDVAELLRWIHARVGESLPALDGLALHPTPDAGAVLSWAGQDAGLALPVF
jgi:6-pyruvoyltetrahydropterin/6-carboxytetrahydropterin synthase